MKVPQASNNNIGDVLVGMQADLADVIQMVHHIAQAGSWNRDSFALPTEMFDAPESWLFRAASGALSALRAGVKHQRDILLVSQLEWCAAEAKWKLGQEIELRP